MECLREGSDLILSKGFLQNQRLSCKKARTHGQDRSLMSQGVEQPGRAPSAFEKQDGEASGRSRLG